MNGKSDTTTSILSKDTDELNIICVRWICSNRFSISSWKSLPLQRAIVASNGILRRSSVRTLTRDPGFANDKRACGTHVCGIEDAPVYGEYTRTKSSRSTNVDSADENDQGHASIVAATMYPGFRSPLRRSRKSTFRRTLRAPSERNGKVNTKADNR